MGAPLPLARKWALLLAPLAVLIVAAKLLNTDPPTNIAQTTPDAEEAALRTRHYNASLSETARVTEKVLISLKTYGRAWSIAASTSGDTERTLHSNVPVLIFIDDMDVTMTRQDDGRTRVDVRSASRVGQGDFGENRRHILQFLTALDAQLSG